MRSALFQRPLDGAAAAGAAAAEGAAAPQAVRARGVRRSAPCSPPPTIALTQHLCRPMPSLIRWIVYEIMKHEDVTNVLDLESGEALVGQGRTPPHAVPRTTPHPS